MPRKGYRRTRNPRYYKFGLRLDEREAKALNYLADLDCMCPGTIARELITGCDRFQEIAGRFCQPDVESVV